MKKLIIWAVGAAMLAGCGSSAGLARPDSTAKGAAPATAKVFNTADPASTDPAATVVGNGSANLDRSADLDLLNAPRFDIKPFQEAAGTVSGFAPLDSGYGTQLMPNDTQFKADVIAREWSDDSKQVYIGWGFLKTTLLAQTQHFYYSPRKKKKLIITFKLISWKHTVAEEDAPKFDLANKILKGAADVHSWNGRQAHSQAKRSGYTPAGKNEVGVLIHPLVLGPLWVWLDNEDHQYPLMAVKAHSGAVIRDGLEMMAIRYMFTQK
ncbi:MAG: hypothetical protein FJZ01_07055 [Candidatus Sericytochromatia bacterium]|nr:hypothetical protein [Candidatus Tanganyikabacteria bacterium]